MTSVGDPLVGQVLDGRYRITSRLARGGMATVYAAVDMRLTRTVAVKLMHVGLGDEAEFARKFDREARAAARLSHPNVVSVFDQGQALLDGHSLRPYIVMEYVVGSTLRDLIVRESPVAPLRALEVFEPVLAALAAAHDAGLVHRDVKPENVLISDRGQIKVADFGLAKAVSSQTSTATQGLLIGTVSYLPPELVLSGRADARSDVYSAGVVLFELLTGRKPHTGETPIQVAYAHVHHDVPAPSSVRPSAGIPPYLDALVVAATARDAPSRPHDARVLLAQVRRVRAALIEGLSDDPGLTQDLSALRRPGDEGAAPLDPADSEVTQLVPAPAPPRAPRQPPPSVHAPLTFRDAPPPAPLPTLTSRALTSPALTSPAVTRSGAGASALRPPAPPPTNRAPQQRAAAERERQGRRRRRGWLVVLLVLMLTAVAALGAWYFFDGRFTTAPALTSMSRAEAEQVTERAGLRLQVEEAYSESVPRGAVISTEPGPGARVTDGSSIGAVLSQGPERHPMPAVVGLSQAAATAALSEAQLGTGTVTRAWSATVPVGDVVKASARTGASLKPRTAVRLTVSRGPKPIPVTDYTGQSADAAVKALKKAGFTVVERQENSAEVAEDRVLRQSPAAGQGQQGDTVTVTRSLGPVLVTVPNVTSMPIAAAEKVMADAGFRTELRPSAVSDLGIGLVTSTGPKARERAPQGSTVILHVV